MKNLLSPADLTAIRAALANIDPKWGPPSDAVLESIADEEFVNYSPESPPERLRERVIILATRVGREVGGFG